MKKSLIASTPVGTFTRKSDTEYKFICVWASPRAKAAFDKRDGRESGVTQRWVKDRGHITSWHQKRPAKPSQVWDRAATLLGIYEI